MTFPLVIDAWQGKQESLLPSITDKLAVTDYVLIQHLWLVMLALQLSIDYMLCLRPEARIGQLQL